MTRHLSEAERRGQILRAARGVFIDQGFLAARMEDVAKRAQLSKGAVYFYFESKRAIFDALVEAEHAHTVQFLDEAEQDMRPAAIKLVDLGRKYLDYFAGLKSPPRFFLVMSEMSIRDEDIRRRVNAIHERFVDGIARVVAQGTEEGIFAAYDPLAVGLMMKALIDGIAGQSAVGIRPDVDRLSNDGIRMILSGLLATQPSGGADAG